MKLDSAEVCKSPLQGMEKLSELTSILLTIFAFWRTGDKRQLGKNKNMNKANPKSDLQKLEMVYVSVQYTK